MNIWILKSSEPMPVINEGARLMRVGMLAEELSKRGHEVIWFSNSFDHFKKKQLCNKDKIVKVQENYKIYMFYAPGYKRNISFSRIINHKIIAMKFLKESKKLEKPDLIYASFPTIDYAEAAVKYGKKNNVPVIIDIRDLWPDIFKHNLPRTLQIIAMPYIKIMDIKTKKVMKNAYAINAISKSPLEWGLNKGKRKQEEKDKFFYIGYKKSKNTDITNEDIIDKNKFNISFFGTINNQFDYDRIIEIGKKLKNQDKNIIINICGDGPQFEELKEKSKNISNINLLGWVDKKNINYILNNSKIGLAPYKNTFDFKMGVSNKFAEYIAYGLPIIMTSEGYMKELLEKNECGYASQDVNELCKFVIKLKNDAKKYENMSKNANKLYREEFDAEKIYINYANYLEEIGGNKK